MAAVWNEDLIMEIVMRLPLKNAIRCLVLNKDFFRVISELKNALVSSSYPEIRTKVFCQYNKHTYKRFTLNGSKVSISLPRSDPHCLYPPQLPRILDSCNGVLLLDFFQANLHCVFNPITGEFMEIDGMFKLLCNESVRLAVNLDAQNTTFHFKVVVVNTRRIIVLAPFSDGSWRLKSVKLSCGGNYFDSRRSVYVHGCIYWPLYRDHTIIEFHVEKEKTRIITCPHEYELLCGLSDGSLQTVGTGTAGDEIIIHSYDEISDGWQTKCWIAITIPNSRLEFFDGRCLLIGKKFDGIIMHDISWRNYNWVKITGKGFKKIYDHRNDWKTFFSFVPTLARVSDEYLHSPKIKFSSEIKSGLEALRYLLTQEETNLDIIEKINRISYAGGSTSEDEADPNDQDSRATPFDPGWDDADEAGLEYLERFDPIMQLNT